MPRALPLLSARAFGPRVRRLWSRRDPGRLRVLGIAGFASVYLGGLVVATRLDWSPTGFPGYILVGCITVVVLAASARLPLLTVCVVGVYLAAVQFGFTSYEFVVPTEFLMFPLVIAGFLTIASGARPAVILPVYAFLAVGTVLPVASYVAIISAGRPVDEILGLTQGYDRSAQVLLIIIAAVSPVLAMSLRWSRLVAEELRHRNAELELHREKDAVRIAAEERTAIAREIHDVVAHHIAALVIRAQAAVRVADTRPDELRSAVEGVAGSGQEALAALRQVVRVLRVPTGRRDPLESGDIENALSTTVERVRDAGVDVSTRFSVPPTLSDVAHAAVVRIVQESLTNVMLHSAAETAVVEVETHGSDVRIRVSDDGPRRERFPGLQNGGSGIPSMTERARALGGELVAGPAPGGSGWVVIASVPARLDVSQGPAT